MKQITKILNLKSDDELFEYITQTLKVKGITLWDYFVDWKKVLNNVAKYEKEYNILNYLIGKENLSVELTNLILEYPSIIDAIPSLLAIRFKNKRDQLFYILEDPKSFEYEKFDFSIDNPTKEEAENMSDFFIESGLGELIADKKIKNLVDYAMGVEVGLDSNGRKNRGGHQMEKIVGTYVAEVCQELNIEYLKEANAEAIRRKWDISFEIDKSSRRIDFVINNKGRLIFIEVNFYGGGGSKLKSTATEYVNMNNYWKAQGIQFIWITDGAGWLITKKPLREYFDKAEYLLNLEMLKNGILKELLI